MIKIILSIFISSIIIFQTPPIYYSCSSYCFFDANSYEVLDGRNINLTRSVASTSKLMTAIIVLESDKLFDVIVVDEVIKTIEGSAIYVSVGDEISVIDLLYGLLLRSGNDAAVLLAKHVAGTIPNFVKLMNEKAIEIGMINTNFSNPTGLDIYDKGNTSTALDMCKLMSYCLQNDMFLEISSSKYFKSSLKGKWKNKNKLLFDYDYCIAGKTGYTKKAKRTLVTASKKGEQVLVMCTLNCGNDFEFHKEKYEEVYNSSYYFVFFEKGQTMIYGYIVNCKKTIGMRIKKEDQKRITMVYEINKCNNYMRLYLIVDGRIYDENIEVKLINNL